MSKPKITRRLKRNPNGKYCKCGCGQEVANLSDQYIVGHYWRSKTQTKEHNQKKSKSMKGKNTKPKSKKHRENLSISLQTAWNRKESRENMMKGRVGMKRGPQSKEHILKRVISRIKCRSDGYCDAWSDEEYKADIRKVVCSNCGMSEEESLNKWNSKLDLHHKNGNKQDCQPSNFDTLCKSCHASADWKLKNKRGKENEKNKSKRK